MATSKSTASPPSRTPPLSQSPPMSRSPSDPSNNMAQDFQTGSADKDAIRRDSQGAPVGLSTSFDRGSMNSHIGARRPYLSSRSRRSSVFSDISQSVQDSTENLLQPNKSASGRKRHRKEDQTSALHSLPLAFAILPAVGGVFFDNGSRVITDVFLLGLGALFLNWFVRMPWEWYQSAQAVHVIKPVPASAMHVTIPEESDEDGGSDEGKTSPAAQADGSQTPPTINTPPRRPPAFERDTLKRDKAAAELRTHENLALLSCFLGPMLGAYLLHAIRGQLTRPSEGLVSNFNLTIFILAAEIRPCAHLISLIQERTLHLQREVDVNTHDVDRIQDEKISDLAKRLDEAEACLAATKESSTTSTESATNEVMAINEINTTLRQSFQPQVDALNRAVRRYEKRATTQTIQTEARLQDLEARLSDTLALAAVAAKRSQKPGVVLTGLDWLGQLLALPFQALHALLMWPLDLTSSLANLAKVWLFGGRVRKRADGKRREKDGAYRVMDGAQRPLAKVGRR